MKTQASFSTDFANTNMINNLTRTLSNIGVKSFVVDIKTFPIRAAKAKQIITLDKKKRKNEEIKLKEKKRRKRR